MSRPDQSSSTEARAYRAAEMIQLLRNEITWLKAVLSDLVGRKVELVAQLNMRIADIEQRLQAAEQMLATYAGLNAKPGTHRTRRSRLNGDRQGSEGVTRMDIEAVEIPSKLNGHTLHPLSKRAKIIRATKALLQKRGAASRSEILLFLKELDIMGHENNPPAYLSVILSNAKEIFATNGVLWYLIDMERLPAPRDTSSPDHRDRQR